MVFRRRVNVIVSTDSDAEDIYSRFTTPPTDRRQRTLINWVRRLKGLGVWGKGDSIYLFAGANANAAGFDWKRPGTTVGIVGSPTFTANSGYTGTASAGVNHNLACSGCVRGTVNDMAWAVYYGNNVANSTFMGSNDGTGIMRMTPRTATSNYQDICVNDGTNDVAVTGTQTSSLGLFTIQRTASNVKQAWYQSTQVGSFTTASLGLCAQPQAINYRNNAGVNSFGGTRLAQFAYLGASLSATEIAGLATITAEVLAEIAGT